MGRWESTGEISGAIFEAYKSLILTGTGGQNRIDAILAEGNARYAAWLAERAG